MQTRNIFIDEHTIFVDRKEQLFGNSALFFGNNEHHWKSLYYKKIVVTLLFYLLLFPHYGFLSQNFKEHWRKLLPFVIYFILILFGSGSLLIASILPRIYYIFIFYKFTKFWDLYLHFLYVIPIYIYIYIYTHRHSTADDPSYFIYIQRVLYIYNICFNVKGEISVLLQ